MSQKYLYISESIFTAVGDYQGDVAVEVNLPLEGTSKSLKPIVRMTPDNARILARELLQAADRLDGGKCYLPN